MGLLITYSAKSMEVVVSKDGSGDYTSIQEAIDAAPEKGTAPFVIYIKKGIYDEKLFIEKNYISLVGEDRDSTVIRTAELRRIWRESHDSDWGAAAINIKSGVEDLTLANLTVLNNFAEVNPDVNNPNDHTFAIRGGGHRVIILNCNIVATGGDTLSLWNTSGGMYYHNDCYFEGYVDFVCPRGYCYITDSKFFGYNNNASIWHDGSGGIGHKLVIQSSEFAGVDDFALGRYHKDAAFYLLDCHFSDSMRNLGIRFVGSASDYRWGKRVYYHECNKDGEAYGWYANNLQTASRSPHPGHIDAGWTFYELWDPESRIDSLLPMASVPHPFNKEKHVSKNTTLNWAPGRKAMEHNVYLGTHPDSLSFLGTVKESRFTPPLLKDTLGYYWRVDEVGSSDTVKGKLWSFTTHMEALPGAVNEPWPPDGSDTGEAPLLSWSYLPALVDSFLIYTGTASDQLVYRGSSTNASFQAESEAGSVWFWRIDSKNEYGITEGNIWSFRHMDYTGSGKAEEFTHSFRQLFFGEQVGDWSLEFNVEVPGEFTFVLFDLQGRTLQTIDKGLCLPGKHFVSGRDIIKNTGPLQGGYYLCSLISGAGRENIKMYIPMETN